MFDILGEDREMGDEYNFEASDTSSESEHCDGSSEDFQNFVEGGDQIEDRSFEVEYDVGERLDQFRPSTPYKRQRGQSYTESSPKPKKSRSQLTFLEEVYEEVADPDGSIENSGDERFSSQPDSASEDDWNAFLCEDQMAPATNWEEEFGKHMTQVPELSSYKGLVHGEQLDDQEGIEDEPWHPYDPDRLTHLDARVANDQMLEDSGPLREEDRICYGMIHKVRVKALPQALDLSKHMTTTQTTLQTTEKHNIYVFKVIQEGIAEKSKFFLQPQEAMDDVLQPINNAAILNKRSSGILAQIGLYTSFDAYVYAESWNSAINRAMTIDKDTCIEVDVVIYGLRKDYQYLGNLLEIGGIHLQEPDYYDKSVGYRNPHFLDLSLIQLGPDTELDPLSSSLLQSSGDFQQLHISDDLSSTSAYMKQKIAAAFKNSTRAQSLRRISAHMGISTPLLPYQEEALDFIMQRESGPIEEDYCLWRSKDSILHIHTITGEEKIEAPVETGGGILADEMGLGKTLTMLSIISNTRDEAREFTYHTQMSTQLTVERPLIASRATLVVVPSPLLLNEWQMEIKAHCTGFKNVITYHSHGREGNAKVLANSDIVLSTYHTISSESTDKTSPIWEINWFRIILDEAHIIRRTTTKLFKAMKKLHSARRWCLTGTPIQNSLEDLAALVNFIGSYPLDNLQTFKKHIIIPLIKKEEKGLANLRLLLDSVCLHRTKDLLELPEVFHDPRLLEFSVQERKLYIETRDRLIKQINQNRLQPHQKGYMGVFQLQLQLRRLCNHGTFQRPSFDAEDFDPEQAIAELKKQKQARCGACGNHVTGIHGIEEQRSGSFTTCGHLLCSKCVPRMKEALRPINGRDGCFQCSLCPETIFGEYLVIEKQESSKRGTKHLSAWQYFDKDGCSTKVSAVVADIEHHKKDDGKSIVFSCWTRSLDLIGVFLRSRKIAFVRIDGSHTVQQRKKILENYQKYPEIKILLMTTGTGAVGLNLTVANCVYILEPQWNPMIETQAIARVNRLGQTRDVRVVRYIMKGTVEELELQSQQLRKLEYAKVGWETDTRLLGIDRSFKE